MRLRARLESWLVRRWYGSRPILPLLPLSWLFGGVVALRRWLYRRGLLKAAPRAIPVLVVGNLTVGGAGKTPAVLALIEGLRARGWRPGVISRGHGGDAHAAALLPEQPDPRRFGDEPSLIRKRSGVPVAVARRRSEAAALLERMGEVDLLIADDGLQHYALARDIEVLVVDGERRFGNAALLPAGPLREPLARAGACAARVCNGGTPQSGEWSMRLQAQALRALGEGSAQPPEGGRVHAVAGIAHPARFFASLRALGFDPIEHAFADHHPFVATDLEFADDLPVLMTEKDAVKCGRFASARCFYLPVSASLPEALFDLLHARLKAAQDLRGHR
ncbi:tetraacyldisaccharide 4'-kinase [Aquimonas voraii]|uniref:Tetraacyldisaccharide 4'-kinase n=1 Tax=Aquimonas voraii TaxID=265719 RepID=A0A1G6SGW6_9GAMM|nr:tetraacyldisaccharide 4'-kinase [Aquimonas voraii]SDD16129.1 lipid-A-disaccharide kinase [Aquimonas voraii]